MAEGLFEWNVDFSELLELASPSAIARIDRAVNLALEKEMVLAAEKARASTEFKDRTGALRDSITFEVEGDISSDSSTARLFSPLDYAGFIEDGTSPHIIEPNGKFLHWVNQAGSFWAKKVHHPGIRARRFLANSVDTNALSNAVANAVAKGLAARRK